MVRRDQSCRLLGWIAPRWVPATVSSERLFQWNTALRKNEN